MKNKMNKTKWWPILSAMLTLSFLINLPVSVFAANREELPDSPTVTYSMTFRDGRSANETVPVAADGTYRLHSYILHAGYQWTATPDGTTAFVFPKTVTESTTFILFETEILGNAPANVTPIPAT